MVPKMDTGTTGSKSLSAPPGRKNQSAPHVSFITTGDNQLLFFNFSTMLPNFGTGFTGITKFLVIWYILHGDDDVLRALLGDDEFWEDYDEMNRVDGLCASANFVHEVIVRWKECYASCNEHIWEMFVRLSLSAMLR